mmetsp:Transcript_9873/g.24663  ORF Transcript_9873/g.24663 Transcript_9873/m.24663 type:complete len:215 (+) Transcript_9873:735-1379(+)
MWPSTARWRRTCSCGWRRHQPPRPPRSLNRQACHGCWRWCARCLTAHSSSHTRWQAWWRPPTTWPPSIPSLPPPPHPHPPHQPSTWWSPPPAPPCRPRWRRCVTPSPRLRSWQARPWSAARRTRAGRPTPRHACCRSLRRATASCQGASRLRWALSMLAWSAASLERSTLAWTPCHSGPPSRARTRRMSACRSPRWSPFGSSRWLCLTSWHAHD